MVKSLLLLKKSFNFSKKHLHLLIPKVNLNLKRKISLQSLRDASEQVDVSSSAVSSSSSSVSVVSGSSDPGSGSTHRPGMRQAES